MAAVAKPSLTNFQPLRAQPASTPMGLVRRLVAMLALWRRRIRERNALAGLTERELADFGASTADVYRELSTPFWRSPPPC